jgi:hypothetical protein
MEAAKICFFPGKLLMKVPAKTFVVTLTEQHRAPMHPLPAWAVPSLDGVEVVEFRHATARGSQMTLRPTFPDIDPPNIEDVSKNAPVLVKLTRLEASPHPGKAFRIVDLIAVESEDPGMGSGIYLDQIMANRRRHDTVNFELLAKFGFQLLKNFKRAIR